MADVETALAYWADYKDEIDELISRHRACRNWTGVGRRRLDGVEAIKIQVPVMGGPTKPTPEALWLDRLR